MQQTMMFLYKTNIESVCGNYSICWIVKKKIKAENEDYKVILCPQPWAKSLINWLTAKTLFTLIT